MSEMVERVARAICEAGNIEGFRCVCPHPVDGWCLGGRLAIQARAAIAVQRYGGSGVHPWAPYLHDFSRAFVAAQEKHGFYESVMAGLNAMLDAALGEKP